MVGVRKAREYLVVPRWSRKKMTTFNQKFFHSVIFQILVTMLVIAGMALLSMSLSVYVTLDAQDDAEAINLAGSLRMQSYRIATTLHRASDGVVTDPWQRIEGERAAFSGKLYRSSMIDLIEESGNAPLQQSYRMVVRNWQDKMEPLLASTSAYADKAAWQDAARQYDRYVADYVDDIDLMVKNLQWNTEGKIELLGMAEGASILLTLFTVIFVIMRADSHFATPLRGLVKAARNVEKGDFSFRTSYAGKNELGLLSQTFNSMTENLNAQYRNLEQQVAERTEKLRKSNQALNFLYKTSREIVSSPYDQQLLNIFLRDLRKVIDVDLINLCINAEPNYADYHIFTTADDTDEFCSKECMNCDRIPGRTISSLSRDVSLALVHRDDKFGFLYVRTGAGAGLDSWQYQLLKAVAETLSTAYAFHHTLGRERRVVLHEERSTIARELHDSLAQSLSYMKMEVARMKKLMQRGAEPEKVAGAISDLQQGLNAAYKHLRELLVTFRVKLDAPTLRAALEQAVGEFDAQTPASVTLNYALGSYPMTANEDIHVLHILREALNNAIKHSRANSICLRCLRAENGEALFILEDNGVGMPENPVKQHHYGIYSMRERAQQLRGELTFAPLPEGGTRVQLRLRPPPDLLHA